VSNANGKIGLVGYWDGICFDEFAGKDKKVDKTLVDIKKNYMANRTFSRGIEQLSGGVPAHGERDHPRRR
jgi:ATP-dependent Lon protease